MFQEAATIKCLVTRSSSATLQISPAEAKPCLVSHSKNSARVSMSWKTFISFEPNWHVFFTSIFEPKCTLLQPALCYFSPEYTLRHFLTGGRLRSESLASNCFNWVCNLLLLSPQETNPTSWVGSLRMGKLQNNSNHAIHASWQICLMMLSATAEGHDPTCTFWVQA